MKKEARTRMKKTARPTKKKKATASKRQDITSVQERLESVLSDVKKLRQEMTSDQGRLEFSAKDIKKIIQGIERIIKIVENLPNTISQMPNSLVDAIRKKATELVGLGVHTKEAVQFLREAVEHTYTFVKHLLEEYREWKKNEDTFKKRLDNFIADFIDLAAELSGIPGAAQINVKEERIGKMVNLMPSIVLYGVSMQLEAIPDWHEAPGKLTATVRKITKCQQLTVSQSHLATLDPLITGIKVGRALARVVSKGLGIVITMLPNDLTINVSILGEGGGTEVIGHPAKFPFKTVQAVVDLVEELLGDTLEFYALCQQDAATTQILNRLAAIEQAASS